MASLTSGLAQSAFSISSGYTFIPLASTIRFFLRPFKCCRRCLWILPVSQRHIRTMYEYLPITGNTHIHAWKRFPHGIEHVFVVGSDGNDRGTLGSTVTLHNAEPHILPSLGQLRRQIGPSADEKTKVTTEALMYRTK